jgi:hypothetical protein
MVVHSNLALAAPLPYWRGYAPAIEALRAAFRDRSIGPGGVFVPAAWRRYHAPSYACPACAEDDSIRSVETSRAKSGLSVPVLTVLDGDNQLIEEDQRALVRHVVQDGESRKNKQRFPHHRY